MADQPADLRSRLKALVGEMDRRAGVYPPFSNERSLLVGYAMDLAALLAESEPEPSFRDVTATRCLRHATIPPTILPPANQECGLCMREEGVLAGRSEQRPERAWLIESRFTPAPTWWMGTDHPAPWTSDSLKAVRFCRKRDAEDAMAALQDGHFCFVSEHQWGFGREPEGCGDRNHDGLRDFLTGLHEGVRFDTHAGPQPWMGQDVALLAHMLREAH